MYVSRPDKTTGWENKKVTPKQILLALFKRHNQS